MAAELTTDIRLQQLIRNLPTARSTLVDQPEPLRTFGRLRVLSVQDALNAPCRSYILDGLLAPGELSVWWGKPKCGKSFLMLRLAYGMSQGIGMWGRDAEKVSVLYVAAEGESGIKGRIRALHDELGDAPDFHLIAQSVNLFDPKADLEPLIAAALAYNVRHIVLDTLARIMVGGDESSARDMGTLVANCDAVRERTEAHVSVVHHAGWDDSHARGSTALIGAADIVLKVGADAGGNRSATVEYAKDDATPAPLGFALNVFDLPPDSKGNVRSTCLAIETDTNLGGHRASSQAPRLTDNEKTGIRTLKRAIDDKGVMVTVFENHTQGLAVDVRHWREVFYREGMPGKLQNTKKKTFGRLMDALLAKDLVGSRDDFIWLKPAQS